MQAAAGWLHTWGDRLNDTFFEGRLPQFVLSFERTRKYLGHFVPGRNLFGLVFNINISALDRPRWDVLATLLHEMVHLWQQQFAKPGRGNYHNREFVEKARRVGLHCERGRGCHHGVTDPFISLLREYGEPVAPFYHEPLQRHERPSRLSKYVCSADCPVARVADSRVPFRARCTRCGRTFERAD